jgi:cytidylate kinase
VTLLVAAQVRGDVEHEADDHRQHGGQDEGGIDADGLRHRTGQCCRSSFTSPIVAPAMIVAIDGPAGAGKSTVARAVARALGFPYLDSGAMYRCAALAWPRDPARLDIRFEGDRVLLDGEDVSEAIRTPEISRRASELATDPAVREAMLAKQRALIAEGDWVAEGRDIGTVVAPDAEVKVWLTAAEAERARRRGQPLDEVRERDARDAGREHSPMVPAPDAIDVDTTGLSIEEVVERIAGLVGERTR